MVIQHNIAAINSHRNLGINNSATSKNLEKLSSGFRINRAGDDAAGLAISEKMRGQIRGLAMAEQNTSNGISLIQTAEGGLNETHAILQRMRELAVQASNGTYQNEDRAQIALEVDALKGEIDRIASSTHYNKIDLLNGTFDAKALDVAGLQTISGTATGVAISLDAAAATALGIDSLAVGTHDFTLVVSNTTGEPTVSLQFADKTYVLEAARDGSDLVTGVFGYKNAAGVVQPVVTLTAATAGADINDAVIKFSAEVTTANQLTVANLATPAAGATYSSPNNQLIFQIGANGTADQQVGVSVKNMSTANIGGDAGLLAGISVASREQANAAIEVIDQATNMVSGQRAELGALQNRLEHTLNNLGVTKENLTAAESTIRDVDMAKEMMEFTKNSILVQASQAMLAQANQLPQGVLSLLR